MPDIFALSKLVWRWDWELVVTEHLLNSLLWKMNERGDMYLPGRKSPKCWALRRFMGFYQQWLPSWELTYPPNKGTLLKMIFLFPRWDMYPFPGGYCTYSMVLTLPKHTKPSLVLVGRQFDCLGKWGFQWPRPWYACWFLKWFPKTPVVFVSFFQTTLSESTR